MAVRGSGDDVQNEDDTSEGSTRSVKKALYHKATDGVIRGWGRRPEGKATCKGNSQESICRKPSGTSSSRRPRRVPDASQTSTIQDMVPGIALHLSLSSVTLPKPSWVKISQIRTLAVQRIGKKIGQVSPEELDQLIEGLFEIVGR